MNWSAIGNALGSAFAVALASFGGAMQMPDAKPESAGVAAGIAFLGALIQHFRQPPATLGGKP